MRCVSIRNCFLLSRFWAQLLRLGRGGAAGALFTIDLNPALTAHNELVGQALEDGA
jgi:hypothetical protein